MPEKNKIVVMIPCYNEEITIGNVVKEFQKYLPESHIIVFDNNSSDRAAKQAELAGAEVIQAYKQGKGNVVKQMFRDIDSEIYLMVDGDGTYPAVYAPQLVYGIRHGYDMMLGDRLHGNYCHENKRCGHGFGNFLVCGLVNGIYNGHIPDVMTGFRAFSERFVNEIVLESEGFEIETEMSIKALQKHMKIGSVSIHYRQRPQGSVSKLSTVRDGVKVVKTIFENI